MRNKKITKIIIGFLIFSQLSFLPTLAFAFAVSPAVPTADSNNGNSVGGSAGIIQNGVELGELAPPFADYKLCAGAVLLAEQLFNKANLANSTSAVMSPTGNGSLLLSMGTLDGAYTTYILCAEGDLTALSAVETMSTYTTNVKQQYAGEISTGLATYKKKQDDLEARIDNANQGFWKTLLVALLLKTSKAMANALVSKLVNNYKIKDFKQYADSVATLVYDNQFIRENYPDKEGQMMARAILNNPLLRNQVPTALFVAADKNLGFDPGTLSPNDPNYYTKMASVGAGSANPYLQQSIYVSNVDAARAKSMNMAQNQIAQSNGLKTPVNCAGSLAQQNSIDAQTKALSAQLDNRTALLNNLNAAKGLGQNVSSTDIAKAQADYNTALNTWNKSPDALGSGNAAIIMCEAIVAPPILINKGIDQAFNAIGVNMAQYNSNNLPAFINTITDVASQIGTSFIFGGSQGAQNAAVMSEGKLVGAAVAATSDYVSSNTAANIAKGIINFSFDSGTVAPNSYSLSWEVSKDVISSASYVVISGDGAPMTINQLTSQKIVQRLPLTGTTAITTTKGGIYTLTVYDGAGKVLTSASTSFAIPATPLVNGAFTAKPSLSIRGPEPEFNPRGE